MRSTLICLGIALGSLGLAAHALVSDDTHTTLGASIKVFDPEHGNQLVYQFNGEIQSFKAEKVIYAPGEWYYSVTIDQGDGASKSYFFDSFTTLAGFRMQ